MKKLVEKYARKTIRAGLADNPLICGLEDEVYWNRDDQSIPVLETILKGMNINSLICAVPAEPYRSIIACLGRRFPEVILPRDCETRTFLHDLPVITSFDANVMLAQLKKRKSVIIAENGSPRVVTFGTVTPEQAFVTFSSVCFATFVLFFSSYLDDLRQQRATPDQYHTFARVRPWLDQASPGGATLLHGPFTGEAQVMAAIIEAGKLTVDRGLVDSYFGNISYRLDDTVFISQTGSSLDELTGCIDPCPLDGSSCAGVTASSELSAHNEIFLRTDNLAILHGHPKFAVILSMDCTEADCPNRGRCHIRCSRDRVIGDIPIVPGEVGTGPTGLCNTLPPAIMENRGAIVWGHGLFTTGAVDFNEAFTSLAAIEEMCRQRYLAQVKDLMIS